MEQEKKKKLKVSKLRGRGKTTSICKRLYPICRKNREIYKKATKGSEESQQFQYTGTIQKKSILFLYNSNSNPKMKLRKQL